MALIVLFLHGMGKRPNRWVEEDTSLLSKYVKAEFIPLSYSDVVESCPLLSLAKADQGDDYENELAVYFADGFMAARLELEEYSTQLEPMGDRLEGSATVVMNLYKYAFRYLLRRNVQTAIYGKVHEQFDSYVRTSGIHQRSLILLCHSLGCVIGLDIMESCELSRHVSKFVTVGSPLGGIASIPWVGARALPFTKRDVRVPWIDVAAKHDLVAKVRISGEKGFFGNPLDLVTLKGSYEDAHGAYFSDEKAVSEWVANLG